jgi:hypothetical protein
MKKYRTKSGTVEEKLPGVNATVNPSEKTQIAMAGGANTLKDVQIILGQEGKRNNLKGQGAKHLVSFMGFAADTGYDDPSDTPTGGVEGDTGDVNFGGTPAPSIPSFDTGYSSDIGPDLSSYPATPQEEADKAARAGSPEQTEPGATSLSGRAFGRGKVAQGMPYIDPDEIDPYTPKLMMSPLDKDQRTAMEKSIVEDKAEWATKNKTGVDWAGAGETAKNVGTGLGIVFDVAAKNPLGLVMTAAGYALEALLNPDPTVEETAAMENPYADPNEYDPALTLNPDPDPETIQYDIRPTPLPDPEGSPKDKELIRSAANNVTLPISEKKDKRSLRNIMRGRGGWRFA